jgi:hypothetical protein
MFNEACDNVDVWESYNSSTFECNIHERREPQQNVIDLSLAIRFVNFDASISVFLVRGILPVHCFVETSCVIGL